MKSMKFYALYCFTGWWCNNHLEKYEFVNGKDDIPYMKWKITAMFETTNQLLLVAQTMLVAQP